ncbi:hypothetical protein CAL7102_04129 [Dulcicalothrix desertica PCC 7102]|nr:hypothetical protein CAL7102_04129 [Dulcicalothrix desertica PCC 7102]
MKFSVITFSPNSTSTRGCGAHLNWESWCVEVEYLFMGTSHRYQERNTDSNRDYGYARISIFSQMLDLAINLVFNLGSKPNNRSGRYRNNSAVPK